MNDTYHAANGADARAYLSDATVYRRSPLVKAMKSILASTRAIAPPSIYEPAYDFLFTLYKHSLAKSYLRHVAWNWLSANHTELFRARSIYEVMPYSLVGAAGLEATFDAALELVRKQVPGDFVECGVARGGCSALMAKIGALTSPPRKMWLFDSFEGLPSPTSPDYDETHKATGDHIRPLDRGSCLGTLGQVEWLLFTRFAFSRDSTFLIKGWFQETLPTYKNTIGSISLLRIDGDWYESTICCLDNLYDIVSPGGCVIVDDYGVCFGCKRAVHDFFERRSIHPHLIPDSRGGVRFSKDG